MLLIVSVLTGCSVATGMPTSLPVTGAHSAGLTSSPQIGGPTASGDASSSMLVTSLQVLGLPGRLRVMKEAADGARYMKHCTSRAAAGDAFCPG